MEVEDKQLMSQAVCHFAHGKKCCKCGAEATDIRIEYPCHPNANQYDREEAIVEFILDLVDVENDIIKETDKIKPYCYICHRKHSEEDIPFADTGEFITFIGDGQQGLCRS